jgi:predicted transcriptional regulator
MHVEILEILDHCGPLKLTPIMYIVNVDCSILKQTLVFLAKQGRLKRKSLNEKEKSLR